ncbi:hypothetical protein OWR29_00205 [Actinoplanes sp. Pm04-4]|uniref:Uncharacterized protein n=1 Tax=Paractinoplanes pyxinae TaxID=2997416 RepID=A0ABT4AQ86_9ACTN|nr:hypothetical protein [Actinoplanes pyxinae]MCY1136400.1 hypothetical protein [Actinoplanes pyxinae]
MLPILIGLWQLAYQLDIAGRVLLPSPHAVWAAGLWLHSSGVLWPNLWSTLGAALGALALSAVVGIPAGILLGRLPRTWAVLAAIESSVLANRFQRRPRRGRPTVLGTVSRPRTVRMPCACGRSPCGSDRRRVVCSTTCR